VRLAQHADELVHADGSGLVLVEVAKHPAHVHVAHLDAVADLGHHGALPRALVGREPVLYAGEALAVGAAAPWCRERGLRMLRLLLQRLQLGVSPTR
jgi:hypothetical protein